jgi:hypothetical protein
MGWATFHIKRLSQGEEVTFRPRGTSMSGKIESGQEVTVRPLTQDDKLEVGNIVLCRVRGADYLHLIKAIRGNPDQYQIGNNKGGINGWIPRKQIFGILVKTS